MKPFESFLAAELEAFIQFRISKGFRYKENKIRTCLLPFDRFLVEKQAGLADLSPVLFLDFRQHFRDKPPMVNKMFIFLRAFFDYLVRIEQIPENPLRHIDPVPECAFIPFIFAPEQITLLLTEVQHHIRKTPLYFLYDLGVYVAILLLAHCGLRISEPLRLRKDHYRSDDFTLYIEKSKFNKDRLIPLPMPVVSELNNYLSVINASEFAPDNPHLLAGFAGKSVCSGSIYNAFHNAVKAIHMNQNKQVIGNTTFASPTPHSLRHSFAVNTLMRVKLSGNSTQNALPVLSAYMGHRDYRYTSKYLKLVDAGHRQALVDFCIKHRESS